MREDSTKREIGSMLNILCFVCKKIINIEDLSDNKEKFVYVHFTDMSNRTMPNTLYRYIYFCCACWRNCAGDEFLLLRAFDDHRST